MMRFKEFLSEEQISLEQVISEIKQNCKPWIDAVGVDKFLYRGMPETKQLIKKNPHPSYRPPRDSDDWFNVMFNAGVDHEFGIDDVRTTTVFCSGHSDNVLEYGRPNFIFPIGEFEILWSPWISDSYAVDNVLINDFVEELHYRGFKVREENISEAFKELIDIHSSSIRNATKLFLNDDPLVCDLFDLPRSAAEGIRDALGQVMKNRYKTDDVTKALKSGHEILMYRSEGYYSIPRLVIHDLYKNNPNLEGQSAEEIISNLLHPGA